MYHTNITRQYQDCFLIMPGLRNREWMEFDMQVRKYA